MKKCRDHNKPCKVKPYTGQLKPTTTTSSTCTVTRATTPRIVKAKDVAVARLQGKSLFDLFD